MPIERRKYSPKTDEMPPSAAARIKTSWLYELTKRINTAPSLYLKAGAIHGCVLCQENRPLIYMEEARAAYWREVAGKNGLDQIDYVIGSFSLRFIERIHFPQTLKVGLRVSRLGGSSFTMQYELRNTSGALLATGESVQVMYDYAAQSSKSIPDEIRARIRAYEPALAD